MEWIAKKTGKWGIGKFHTAQTANGTHENTRINPAFYKLDHIHVRVTWSAPFKGNWLKFCACFGISCKREKEARNCEATFILKWVRQTFILAGYTYGYKPQTLLQSKDEQGPNNHRSFKLTSPLKHSLDAVMTEQRSDIAAFNFWFLLVSWPPNKCPSH